MRVLGLGVWRSPLDGYSVDRPAAVGGAPEDVQHQVRWRLHLHLMEESDDGVVDPVADANPLPRPWPLFAELNLDPDVCGVDGVLSVELELDLHTVFGRARIHAELCAVEREELGQERTEQVEHEVPRPVRVLNLRKDEVWAHFHGDKRHCHSLGYYTELPHNSLRQVAFVILS